MHVQILFLIFAAAERNDFRRQRPPPRIDLLNNEISCNSVDVRAIEQEIPPMWETRFLSSGGNYGSAGEGFNDTVSRIPGR